MIKKSRKTVLGALCLSPYSYPQNGISGIIFCLGIILNSL